MSTEALPRGAGESLLRCLQYFLPSPLTLLLTGLFPTPLGSFRHFSAQPVQLHCSQAQKPGPKTPIYLPAPWATLAAAQETQAMLLLWSSAERKAKNRSLCTQGHLSEAIKLPPQVDEAPAGGEGLTVRNRVTRGPLEAFGGSPCGTLEQKP